MPLLPQDVQVKVFNHRQQLLMLFLCMVRKGVKSLAHELGLHIASFLPHIGTNDTEYKRLYQAFLEDGFILGPLLRLEVECKTFVLIGGDVSVSQKGKIEYVRTISFYYDQQLSFFNPEKEFLTFDTLKDRSEKFKNESVPHRTWLREYKKHELNLRAFREKHVIEHDYLKRKWIALQIQIQEDRFPLTIYTYRTIQLINIQALEKNVLALEQKIQNISLYL